MYPPRPNYFRFNTNIKSFFHRHYLIFINLPIGEMENCQLSLTGTLSNICMETLSKIHTGKLSTFTHRNIVKHLYGNIVKNPYWKIVNFFANKFIASQPYSETVKQNSGTVKLSKVLQMIFTGKCF